MRLIDADALEEVVQTNLRKNPHKDGRARAFHNTEHIHFLDAIRRIPTITPPANDPLTMEKLLEMDGEPVWDNSGNCFIVRINVHGTDECGADKFATYTKLDILCKRGLYRRNPEEGIHEH